jgi:hypothetical protein
MKVRVKNNVKALVKYRVLCLQSFPGEWKDKNLTVMVVSKLRLAC